MIKIAYRRTAVDSIEIFYREAGRPNAPALLLLHGFPTASHMFRDLIPQLADRFHVIAPDLPGFGQSDMPERTKFNYTFDNIAAAIDRFTEVIGLRRFAIYVFDYGAPTGFRLAMRHPERITAIISQNGNAYVEGLSDGVADPSSVSPDGYSLDNFYLARPGADDVQLDLFGDYKSNVALYPEFQAYFRKHKPPFLAAWGKNDPFFLPQGAEAFKRDIPDADVRFFDSGHFALETHCDAIAAAIRDFLSRAIIGIGPERRRLTPEGNNR
jgi:pimeloyl-ACP methyl ester carboxylesterase